MRKAGYLLSQSGRMILICDAQATVLDLTGDPATVDRGMENHLHSHRRADAGAQL